MWDIIWKSTAWVVVAGAIGAVIAGVLTRELKISEFRQEWINELRKDIADYIGLARKWFRLYEELNDSSLEMAVRAEKERKELFPLANDALVVLWRIKLRFSPRENLYKQQDERLLQSLLNLIDPGKTGAEIPGRSWQRAADETVELAREILKREWEITKRPWLKWRPWKSKPTTVRG